MKSITNLFKEAFQKKKERNWEKIFVLVDLHDTIIKGCYNSGEFRTFDLISLDAVEVLKLMTLRKDICLILWTSTNRELKIYTEWLDHYHDIQFDYVNENPEVKSTEYAYFGDKMYFNVIIDDKAGFEPSDWLELKENLHLMI